MPSRRACLSAPVAAILGALVVACSSTWPSSSTTTTSASPSASASASFNGAQLSAALLPGSDMPSGFKPDPSGERSTGVSTAPDTVQRVPASKECSLLTGTAWIATASIVAGSFAQNDYVNADNTEEIAQEADAYSGGDAQHAMETLWQIFGKCSHFTVDSGGTSAATTMVRTKLNGVGDQAYEAVQTSPAYEGGTTLVAIRVGNVIVTCMDSSTGNDKGSAALRYAERIAVSVQKALRLLGWVPHADSQRAVAVYPLTPGWRLADG